MLPIGNIAASSISIVLPSNFLLPTPPVSEVLIRKPISAFLGQVIHGDCIVVMRTTPSQSVDLVATRLISLTTNPETDGAARTTITARCISAASVWCATTRNARRRSHRFWRATRRSYRMGIGKCGIWPC